MIELDRYLSNQSRAGTSLRSAPPPNCDATCGDAASSVVSPLLAPGPPRVPATASRPARAGRPGESRVIGTLHAPYGGAFALGCIGTEKLNLPIAVNASGRVCYSVNLQGQKTGVN